jgi:hypothetical protein
MTRKEMIGWLLVLAPFSEEYLNKLSDDDIKKLYMERVGHWETQA